MTRAAKNEMLTKMLKQAGIDPIRAYMGSRLMHAIVRTRTDASKAERFLGGVSSVSRVRVDEHHQGFHVEARMK